MKSIFDERAQDYDAWFDEHPSVYLSELAALRKVVTGGGLEVGVGTGRFALPLNIEVGVDPSFIMLSIAQGRGIKAVRGMAEALPFRDNMFDHVLFVTTLCYVTDPLRALLEAKRVARDGGRLVIGLIDKDSTIGQEYIDEVKGRAFFQGATFRSTGQVLDLLRAIDCAPSAIYQTVFHDPREMAVPDSVLPGNGKGLFVVIMALK